MTTQADREAAKEWADKFYPDSKQWRSEDGNAYTGFLAGIAHARLEQSSARVIQRLENDGIIPPQNKLEHCQKIVSAVYLACEEVVAKDISTHMQWLIDEVTHARKEQVALVEACESLIGDYARAKGEVESHRVRIVQISPEKVMAIADALAKFKGETK